MSEFPNPEESPFEHPNGNTYVWNGWAWEIEGKSNDYATEEYVDDATTQTLKDSKAYTDEKIAEGVEGLASEEYVSNAIDAIPEVEIPEVELDEYATIEYVDDASERLQGQINDLVIEGTDLFRVAGEWNFRPLQGNDTLEDGFVKIEAPGMWFEWEDPSTWTHITIPVKDQNGKSHPGLENILAGEVIAYQGMHDAQWMTNRNAELVQENGVDAYRFQVTFINGTNEGSRLIDGLLVNKYSTPPSDDPGGDGGAPLPDDPSVPKLDESNTFTAKQVYDVDSGQALVIKKNGGTGVEFFGSGRIKQYGDQENKNGNDLINRQNLDDAIAEIPASKDYYLSAVDSSSHATLKLGDSENEQNNWTQVDFFGGKGINVSTDEIMQSITITADDVELPDNLATTDYVDEAIDAIDIPELELPQTLAYTDKSNHFTARQNIELDSGTGLLIKKGDDESFKLFADGTAEQLIEHDNVKPSHIVTRKNLTDALDSVSLGSVLEEADNNFRGSQSFRISGTHGSPIQVYAPKNGGGEQEIFAVSVVPANDDKVGERETESSAYYRGRIASETSLVNKKYVDDAVDEIDLDAYVSKAGYNELSGPFIWKPPHHSDGNLNFELKTHGNALLFGTGYSNSKWMVNYYGEIEHPKSVVTKDYVDSKLVPQLPDDLVTESDLEAYVTKAGATSELTYRDKIFEEIFEDIDDALIDLKRTDQTLTDGLATVNTDAAFLNKLNRFTAKQRIEVSDSVALQITKDNSSTLDVWATGEVQQKDERPNSHPNQFVTRKNMEEHTSNYRPYSWVNHTVAGDLNPGECFVADNGYLYLSIRDADGNLAMLDGTYTFAEKSHLYYRNSAGEAVELFSITNVNVTQGSYIRFQGEEEVVKNHLSVDMHTFDAAVFI